MKPYKKTFSTTSRIPFSGTRPHAPNGAPPSMKIWRSRAAGQSCATSISWKAIAWRLTPCEDTDPADQTDPRRLPETGRTHGSVCNRPAAQASLPQGGESMQTLVGRGCGLDVHQATVVACLLMVVPNGKVRKQMRTFGTTTRQLLSLRQWLLSEGCTRWRPAPYGRAKLIWERNSVDREPSWGSGGDQGYGGQTGTTAVVYRNVNSSIKGRSFTRHNTASGKSTSSSGKPPTWESKSSKLPQLNGGGFWRIGGTSLAARAPVAI